MQDQRKDTTTLIVYYLLFYILWALCELLLEPKIDSFFNNWVSAIVQSGIIKNALWTLPAILLILRYETRLRFSLREMFTFRFNWLKILPIFAAFTVYILLSGYIAHGKIMISPDFQWDDLIVVAFVGITEETVFRGWLLNATIKTASANKQSAMIALNAVLFLLIHFPRWYCAGILVENFMNLGFLCILFLSVVFSYAFIKSKSLVAAIALHMYWDALTFLFV